MPDRIERLERIIKRHIVGSMPAEAQAVLHDTSLHHHLVEYQTWRGRFIAQRPRRVHESKELGAREINLSSLVSKIKVGEDLTPHLSRRVQNPFENIAAPALEHRTDRDALLADWGVHHLHVSDRMKQGTARRGDSVLLAMFRDEDAYLIDIVGHRHNWAAKDILRIVVRNWPRAGLLLESRWAKGVSPDRSDDERRRLRNAGVAAGLIQIDGKVYNPAEIGQTTAGTPLKASRRADALLHAMRICREDFSAVSGQLDLSGFVYWSPRVEVVEDGFEEYAGFAAAQAFVQIGRIC